MNPTKMYVGTWPPPESAEHAGTGSADDDWPPREPDDTAANGDLVDDGAWTRPAAKQPKQPKRQSAAPVELGPEWRETPKAPPPPQAELNPEILAKVELVEVDDCGSETLVPLDP